MKSLRELISTNSYKTVFNELHKAFLLDKSNAEKKKYDINFLSVWEKLQKLAPSKDVDPLQIHLTEIEDDEGTIIDVALLDSRSDELFAMDFVDWGEIIDLPVYHGAQISEKQCLANILWEITFWGFSQCQINKQLNLLTQDD